MSNPKGTYFASKIVLPLLREFYPDAERAPAWGSKDQGDVLIPGERRFVLELKNVQKMNLAGWIAEAQAEALNAYTEWALRGYFGKPPVGVVVHKRRGTQVPTEQYVTMTLGGFLELMTNGRV